MFIIMTMVLKLDNYRVYTRPKVVIDFNWVVIDFQFYDECKQVQVDLGRIKKFDFFEKSKLLFSNLFWKKVELSSSTYTR